MMHRDRRNSSPRLFYPRKTVADRWTCMREHRSIEHTLLRNLGLRTAPSCSANFMRSFRALAVMRGSIVIAETACKWALIGSVRDARTAASHPCIASASCSFVFESAVVIVRYASALFWCRRSRLSIKRDVRFLSNAVTASAQLRPSVVDSLKAAT